jgi:hypothetical protein
VNDGQAVTSLVSAPAPTPTPALGIAVALVGPEAAPEPEADAEAEAEAEAEVEAEAEAEIEVEVEIEAEAGAGRIAPALKGRASRGSSIGSGLNAWVVGPLVDGRSGEDLLDRDRLEEGLGLELRLRVSVG